MKITYLLTCLLIVMSLFLGSGCLLPEVEFSPAPSPAPAPIPAPAPSPAPPLLSTETIPINPEWAPPLVERQSPALPDFVSVIAEVKPSVVAINTMVETFNIFTGSSLQEGAGSGWIISEDGYIVTNNHVVEGAESIKVILDDGRSFTADMVRADSLTDLAVVKIDAQGLPAASIGDSSALEVGNWVIAIGNSLGLGISATKGIVSSLDVSVPIAPGQTLYDLIQTDAAINPGNSGGPLVNMRGEVIGINSVKVARVGVEGMGYSISTNAAVPIIEELITTGYVVRAWLGVGLFTVDEGIARRYSLAVDKGAVVTQLAAGSPAKKAGIEVGDVIVEFGAKEIAGVDELIREIHSYKPEQSVKITFWREDNKYTVTAILDESPQPE